MTVRGADQWTRFSRPVAKWRVCSLVFGAQCRFIMEACRGLAGKLATYSGGDLDLWVDSQHRQAKESCVKEEMAGKIRNSHLFSSREISR